MRRRAQLQTKLVSHLRRATHRQCSDFGDEDEEEGGGEASPDPDTAQPPRLAGGTVPEGGASTGPPGAAAQSAPRGAAMSWQARREEERILHMHRCTLAAGLCDLRSESQCSLRSSNRSRSGRGSSQSSCGSCSASSLTSFALPSISEFETEFHAPLEGDGGLPGFSGLSQYSDTIIGSETVPAQNSGGGDFVTESGHLDFTYDETGSWCPTINSNAVGTPLPTPFFTPTD